MTLKNDPAIKEVLNEEYEKDNFIIDDDLLKSQNDSDDEFNFLTRKL